VSAASVSNYRFCAEKQLGVGTASALPVTMPSSTKIFGVLLLCTLTDMSTMALPLESNSGIEAYEVSSPPKLHPLRSEFVADENGSFSVRCDGVRPVKWMWEENTIGAPPLSDRVFIKDEAVAPGALRPYSTRFTVSDLHPTDTGPVKCVYKDMKTGDEVTEAYLYVRSNKSLFDSTDPFLFLNALQYMEVVLPCRPTNPNISMTIVMQHVDVTQELAK